MLERGCAVQGEQGAWLDGIIFDITRRRRLEELARRTETEAARRRVVRAADEARGRIERDLHDGAQRSFVSALMTLGAALRKLEGEPEVPVDLLRAAQEHLERGLSDLRNLARGIHPALLEEHGVAAALVALVALVALPVKFADEVGERLPADLESALYFSAAEAIANASKHARAAEVSVRFARSERHAYVEVVDDGVGGAAAAAGGGLHGLIDRLATVGGELHVVSRPGAGTRVTARVPLG